MYKITSEEIDFMLDDITKRGIETEDVRDNILDHVCCIIEHEFKAGGNFKKFYENTIARFYRKELREIENETRDLITFKYFYAMKRTLKITGLLSALLIIIGGLFKFQHWPGAGIALVLGLSIFSLIFVPVNIILKYRDDKEKTNRIIMFIGFTTASVSTIGVLFKVMHWPYANMLFYAGFLIFLLLFIPVYFFTKYKNPESKFNAIVHTTFMIAGCGMLLMLFGKGQSMKVTEGVLSMDTFQSMNVAALQKNNEQLYLQVESDNEKNIEVLGAITEKVNDKITAISANLIAASNGVSVESALNMTSSDMKHPFDLHVTAEYFEKGNHELSYLAFKDLVDEYNEQLEMIDEGNHLIPIEIDRLQMTGTYVTVVLHELLDIQVQILANENSYLSLKKGMLVQNN